MQTRNRPPATSGRTRQRSTRHGTGRAWLPALVAATCITWDASAEMALPDPNEATGRVRVADIVPLGVASATVDTEIVFQNTGDATRRIVFASRDAGAFSCRVDGDLVVRSRSTQYLLKPGAELACSVRPGRYRYTTLTRVAGGVERVESTLRVRSRS